MNINNVQFGKLRVREKSIDTAVQASVSPYYRQARRDFKSGIDYLDKSGLDIDVHMDNELGSNLLNVSLIDKERTIHRSFITVPLKNPWDVLAQAVAMGMELIDPRTQALKKWEGAVDVYDTVPQPPFNLGRDVLCRTKSRLSHRGNRYIVDLFRSPEVQAKIDKAIEIRQNRGQ